MIIAATVARIVLGVVFVVFGASGFFMMGPPPPEPGSAGVFLNVFAQSHWMLFVGAAQVVLGVLLLINRLVPLALIMLAAFLYNSFAFHITMMPMALPAPIIATILWLLVAWQYRAAFAPLFAGASGQPPARRPAPPGGS